jgi:peptidoglycan/xylan/chitin deacetylase (PgdA/CDA1 family)
VLKALRYKVVERLKGRIRSLTGSSAIILLYHSVMKPKTDPQLLRVSPDRFRDHLDVLTSRYTLVSLSELLDRLTLGKVKSKYVAVTFDDGYADNFFNAQPALTKYGVPATVFVSSGNIDTDIEFWWDELERLLLSPGSLPGQFEIEAGGSILRWDLEGSENYSRDRHAQNADWDVTCEQDPSSRHSLYRHLCEILRPLPVIERDQFLAKIRSWAGVTSDGRPEYRSLRTDEITRLVQDGLVEIGSHTVGHPLLSAFPINEQRREILADKARLEQIIDKSLKYFSYPYGNSSSYITETIQEVQKAGFLLACSNFPGRVYPGAHRWELPRFLVRNWDGATFERALDEWFNF